MTIGILATGDEIIRGDTLNTNGHAFAHALTSEGLPVGLHLSCSDEEDEMVVCLQFLNDKHDIIILIGGLGPTSDDRTRFALARFLNVKLIEFPEALTHIQTRLNRGNMKLNSGNRQQALFPEGTLLLPNPRGTAMGALYQSKDRLFFMLPGPPRESMPMFNEYVLPVLQKTQHNHDEMLKWRLFGVSESEIAEILDGALAHVDCETGYRLETPYLEFKVRCKPCYVDIIQQMVEPLVCTYVIATPAEKASERLSRVIANLEESVVILDDITGGLLQTLIQQPSNFRCLSFHETTIHELFKTGQPHLEKPDSSQGVGLVPQVQLYFHLTGLDAFWSDTAFHGGDTTITIEYQYKMTHGRETHQIPYRSPLVVDYAAEWLCFRILQLIDQLHQ